MTPNVAFLGVCEKTELIDNDHPILWRRNIIGLRNSIVHYVFPLNLKNHTFIFAIYDPLNSQKGMIKILRIPDDFEIMSINFSKLEEISDDVENGETNQRVQTHLLIPHWSIFEFTVDIDVTIDSPTGFKLVFIQDDQKIPIGLLSVGHISAPPFSPEFVEAVKTMPFSAKTITIEFGCSKCPYKLKAYAGLEKDGVMEKNGFVWFQDLPDESFCICKSTKLSLKYCKENLHALLMNARLGIPKESFISRYDEEAIGKICVEFKKLINSDTPEYKIQSFIEKNGLVLNQFSPQKLFFKKQILNEFVTDFCILNNKGELLLIEIEKPSLKLLKRDGGIHSELQHAFDQVRNWLRASKEERSAVLRGIGISENVSTIRGIVIAGRDAFYDQNQLTQLKGTDFGEITFYTYSDVLRNLESLAKYLFGL